MRRTALAWAAVVGVIGIAACPDDAPHPGPDGGDGGIDAAVDGGAEPAISPPAAPAPPVEVDLGPCPAGWIRSDDEPAECLPWPAGTSSECEGPTALLPGEGACRPIGAPCPEGDWAVGLPEDGVLYVHPAGRAGAAGTRADPFSSIADALVIAAEGTTVALAKGTWDEVVHVPGGVTLRGACPDETHLAVSTTEIAPVVDVTRGDVVVRDLSIGGARIAVGVHGRLGSARLASVLVEGATTHGLFVYDGGTLVAEDVIVRGTAPRPKSLDLGRGVDVSSGGRVSLARVALEGNTELGAFVAEAGSTLDMVDCVVRDTVQEGLNGTLGRGVEAELGATATLERVVIDRNHSAGVFAGDGATITMSDVRVLDTLPSTDADGAGNCVVSAWEALISGERVVARGCRDAAIDVADGAQMTMSDLVVRDTASRGSDGSFGRGLSLAHGGRLEVRRGLIEASHESGAFAGGDGSELVLVDVTVRGTLPQVRDGWYGRGVSTFDGASVTLERVRVEDSYDVGIGLASTSATLRDVVVSRTRPRQADGAYGRGIVAQDGAVVTLERALVRECHEAGVSVLGAGSELRASDLDVQDTLSAPLGAGRGLAVQTGGSATLSRVRLANSREVGLFASEAGSAITGTDVLVLDTLVRECADDACASFDAGIGVGSYGAASVVLRGFRVERAALVGVQLARGGTIDLSTGVVAGCPIGANVQTEAFDTARLTDGVIYRDNERNFDGDALPLPL